VHTLVGASAGSASSCLAFCVALQSRMAAKNLGQAACTILTNAKQGIAYTLSDSPVNDEGR